MQVASHLWSQGRLRDALALDEREEGALAEMARSPSPTVARVLHAHPHPAGIVRAHVGQPRARAQQFRRSARATLNSDDLPLAPRIEFLIVYGNLKDHAMGDSGETMTMVFEALDLARRHGLVEFVIDAMSGLSSAAQVRGDHQAGRDVRL